MVNVETGKIEYSTSKEISGSPESLLIVIRFVGRKLALEYANEKVDGSIFSRPNN